MKKELSLVDFISEKLTEANIKYEMEKAIGGVEADFLIYAHDGRKIVLEAKNWENKPGFTRRAVHQSNLYKDAIGADEVYFVIDSL